MSSDIPVVSVEKARDPSQTERSMQRPVTPSKESAPKRSPSRMDALAIEEEDTASPPIMGHLETARALSAAVDFLASSSSSVVLGTVSQDSDPMREGMRRILAREMPLVMKRTIVPGNLDSIELFDVRGMVFDERYMEGVLNFRKDAAMPESGMTYEKIMERTGDLAAHLPVGIEGTYTTDGGDDDDQSEDGGD